MLRAVTFFFIIFTAPMVVASNFNFLHEAAPISDFNEADMQLFNDAVQKALNEKKDGEKLAWKNDNTGHSGLVNPLQTLDSRPDACRNVRIINKSKKNIAETRFTFCKQDGTWVAVEMLNK